MKPIRLAAGAVIKQGNEILLVRDKHGWSLPKGSVELGEAMAETAVREVREETGYMVKLSEPAFVVEYRSQKYGQYLQVYYAAEITDREQHRDDPDQDVFEIRFIPVDSDLRSFLTFRPWIIALEEWLNNPSTKYHFFDLDQEGFHV